MTGGVGPSTNKMVRGGHAAGGRSLNSLTGNRFSNVPRHQGFSIWSQYSSPNPEAQFVPASDPRIIGPQFGGGRATLQSAACARISSDIAEITGPGGRTTTTRAA